MFLPKISHTRVWDTLQASTTPIPSKGEEYLMKFKGTWWGLGIGSGQGGSAVWGAWERGWTLTSAWCTLFECLSVWGCVSFLEEAGEKELWREWAVARRVSHRIVWCKTLFLQHYLAKILRASWSLCKQMDTYFLFQNGNAYWMSQWVTILSMLDPLSHSRGNLLTLDTNFGPEQQHLVI